jgi:hypothetical protein
MGPISKPGKMWWIDRCFLAPDRGMFGAPEIPGNASKPKTAAEGVFSLPGDIPENARSGAAGKK